MEKKNTNFIIPSILCIISIYICNLLWSNINLEYTNNYEIVGEYSLNKHHVFNDTLRYLIFVIFPITVFFSSYLLINFNKKINFKKIFTILKYEKKIKISKILFLDKLLLFVSFLLTIFLLKDWNFAYYDIFEEGISLSGSSNYYLNKKSLENIYINTGLFYDVYNGLISWWLTGYKTIGSFKFFISLLNLISNCLIVIFIYKLSKQINLKKYQELFFLIISSIAIFINFDNHQAYRDLPLLIYLISILSYLNSQKKFNLFIISILSVFSFLWSIDRGFYLNLSLISFLVLIFFNNKKDFLKLLALLLFTWFFAILLMGKDQFFYYFLNAQDIFSKHEYLNGLIHPQPFSNEANSTRASKIILIIIINLIISFYLILEKKKYFLNNTNFLLVIFSIINFLKYKTALSRSDGPHIKDAGYFSLTLFFLFIVYFFLKNINLNSKIIKKYIILIYIIVFSFISILIVPKADISNNFNFSNKIINFIKEEDKKFIDNNYKELIEELNNLLANDDCLQLFSYDQGLFYLINKKSCSKFYNIWTIGSKKNQDEYVKEIKINSPKYILTQGPLMKLTQNDRLELSLNDRYPYISEHIENNYTLYKEINSWKILKKK